MPTFEAFVSGLRGTPAAHLRSSVRLEDWARPGGARAFLLAVGNRKACTVHAWVVDGDGRLLYGRDLFRAGALGACRDALLDALEIGRAGEGACRCIGLFDDDGGAVGIEERIDAQRWTVESNPAWPFTAWFSRRSPGRRDMGRIDEATLNEVCHARWMRPAPRARAASAGADLAPASWHGALRQAARPAGLPPGGWPEGSYGLYDVEPPARLRRVQAAVLQPAMAWALHDDRVLAAVDRGRSIEAAVAAYGMDMGLSQARLRRLRAYPRAIDGRFGQGGPGDMPVWGMARDIPLERLPRTGAGWDRLVGECGWIRDFARSRGLDLAPLLAGMPPEWGLRDLTGWTDGDAEVRRRAASEVADVRDVARRFEETVLAHAGVPGPELAALSARILFGKRTLRGVLRLSREWHAGLPALDAALPRRPGGAQLAWLPLFGPLADPDGTLLRCLVTEQELRDEGAGLRHCVGGYGRSCMTGLTHIVSVSAPVEGEGVRRLSTVELTTGGVVRQHRGMANSNPPGRAVAAVAWLLDGLRDGSVPTQPTGAAPVTPGAEPLAYDVAAAIRAWRPYLTPDGRKACEALLADRPRQAEAA